MQNRFLGIQCKAPGFWTC